MIARLALPLLAVLAFAVGLPGRAVAQVSAPSSVPELGGRYAEENIASMTFCSKAEVDALTSDATVQRLAGFVQSYGGVVCPCAEQTFMYYGRQAPIVKYPEVQYRDITSILPQNNLINQTNYPFNLEVAEAYLFLQMIKKHPDAVPMGILGCYRGIGSVGAAPPTTTTSTPTVPATTQSSTNPGGNAVANGGGTSGLTAGVAEAGGVARNSIDRYAFCRRPGRSQAAVDNCLKAIAP